MAKKNKNLLYIGIAVVVIVIAVIIGIVVAKNNGGDGADNTTSQTDGLTLSELRDIDVAIDFGDYDSMQTLAKDIQNGKATGKVVKIEGIVSHPMSTYSVVERNTTDSGSIGTQFIIEGDGAIYPEDGDRIVITGLVVEQSPMYFVIKAIPESIEIK